MTISDETFVKLMRDLYKICREFNKEHDYIKLNEHIQTLISTYKYDENLLHICLNFINFTIDNFKE